MSAKYIINYLLVNNRVKNFRLLNLDYHNIIQ